MGTCEPGATNARLSGLVIEVTNPVRKEPGAFEVGFIRLRPIQKMPELGQARVRVGEGSNNEHRARRQFLHGLLRGA